MNFLSIILIGVIVAYLIFSVVYIHKNKKRGKGCSGNCSSCSKGCK